MMKEKLAKLIDVKSIVTLLLVLTLVVAFMVSLIQKGEVQGELLTAFVASLSAVMTYFFTKKDTSSTASGSPSPQGEGLKGDANEDH